MYTPCRVLNKIKIYQSSLIWTSAGSRPKNQVIPIKLNILAEINKAASSLELLWVFSCDVTQNIETMLIMKQIVFKVMKVIMGTTNNISMYFSGWIKHNPQSGP